MPVFSKYRFPGELRKIPMPFATMPIGKMIALGAGPYGSAVFPSNIYYLYCWRRKIGEPKS